MSERIRWTAWAGSPEMIVHIARVAERAMRELSAVPLQEPLPEGKAKFRGMVLVGRDVELFDDPDGLLRSVTPEALARCREIRLAFQAAELGARVRFLCRPPEMGRVELAVTGAKKRSNDIVAVAGAISIAIQRGFRRHIGKVEGSTNLARGLVGRRSLFSFYFETLTPTAVGAATGALFAFVVSTLFPRANLPPSAFSAACLVPAWIYPLWVKLAIPRVELAVEGKTRLRRATRRAILGLAGLAVTAGLQVLVGQGA